MGEQLRWIPPLLGLLALVATSCADGIGPGRSVDCWGLGEPDCGETASNRAIALGIGVADESPFGGTDCGDPVTCSEVRPLKAPASPSAPRDGASSAEGRPEVCDGIDVRGAARPGSEPSGPELDCLRGLALDHEPLTSDEFTNLQVATIGLVNARQEGWQRAIERSLSYPQLRSSPPLNFAGIEPAYDEGRYPTVLQRANIVWAHLDGGYRLSVEDRTRVAEYACRAGVQLHLQGQRSTDPERWCQIWVERLEQEGGDASEARDLLARVRQDQ